MLPFSNDQTTINLGVYINEYVYTKFDSLLLLPYVNNRIERTTVQSVSSLHTYFFFSSTERADNRVKK